MIKKLGAIGVAITAAFFVVSQQKATSPSDIVKFEMKAAVGKEDLAATAPLKKIFEKKETLTEESKSLSAIVKDLSARQYSKHPSGEAEELKLKISLQNRSSYGRKN